MTHVDGHQFSLQSDGITRPGQVVEIAGEGMPIYHAVLSLSFPLSEFLFCRMVMEISSLLTQLTSHNPSLLHNKQTLSKYSVPIEIRIASGVTFHVVPIDVSDPTQHPCSWNAVDLHLNGWNLFNSHRYTLHSTPLNSICQFKAEGAEGSKPKRTIADVVERLNGLTPHVTSGTYTVALVGKTCDECIPSSPRSVEACLRLGIDPLDLVQRPLSAFRDRREDEDIAGYRHQQYEEVRQVNSIK